MRTYCPTNKPKYHDEIRPLQYALKKAGLYHGPIDGIFGAGTADASYRAKYRLGYPIKNVNHCGGQDLLNFLTGAVGLPPTYIIRRHARGYGISRAQRQRNAIVAHCRWSCNNPAAIHYAQVRPMDHLNKVHALPWWTDCSEYVTTIYKWAGAADPNGMGYNGYGYTGTLLSHGTGIMIYQAQPGDVVIWGSFPGHHCAVIVDTSNKFDPLIASHGSERGPLWMRLSSENRAQGYRPLYVRRYIK